MPNMRPATLTNARCPARLSRDRRSRASPSRRRRRRAAARRARCSRSTRAVRDKNRSGRQAPQTPGAAPDRTKRLAHLRARSPAASSTPPLSTRSTTARARPPVDGCRHRPAADRRQANTERRRNVLSVFTIGMRLIAQRMRVSMLAWRQATEKITALVLSECVATT